LASLATFVVNLYAINIWETSSPEILGIYFLYMEAFLMASTVSTQFLYVPAEKATLEVAQHARTALFGRISRLGMPVGVVAAVLVGLAALVGRSEGISFTDQLPFLLTAATATVFSPLQNHARRLLHLAGKSWDAAVVSIVQATVAAVALIALVQLPLAEEWVPIGALALANILSVSAAALLILRRTRRLDSAAQQAAADTRADLTYRALTPSGRWLMSTGMLSTGNNFLVGSAIILLAGAPANALAGSAKTVAQPILVLANGLRSVIGPRSMEAAKDRDQPRARSMAQTFTWLTVAAVVGYTAIAGFDWVGNPLSRLIEQAYSVPFLVALTIAANGLNSAAFPGRMEMIGAGREKQYFGAEVVANAAQLVVALAVAAAAVSTASGAFAPPIAFAVLGAVRIVAYRRVLADHYQPPAKAGQPPPTTIPPAPETTS
jgi:hypothetical protein